MCTRFVDLVFFFFFFKQKTAYEMRISDRSSDVCSSDLRASFFVLRNPASGTASWRQRRRQRALVSRTVAAAAAGQDDCANHRREQGDAGGLEDQHGITQQLDAKVVDDRFCRINGIVRPVAKSSEERRVGKTCGRSCR